MIRRHVVGLAAALACATAPLAAQTVALQGARYERRDCEHRHPQGRPVCGTYFVYEDRAAQKGRMLGLDVVVLPARTADPLPDPVFYCAGGPGQAATTVAAGWQNSWMREQRDIVLVDQRGTGGSHRLTVPRLKARTDLRSYLGPLFSLEDYRAALPALLERADLTQYSTPIAADDLNEVRAGLGYEQINLIGGSYGTRFALIYMRRHRETVRTATLNGVAPLAFKNPLFHAATAQEGLERVFAECQQTPRLQRVYDKLEDEFAALLEQLAKQPAKVRLRNGSTGKHETVLLTREAFTDALRFMLYYLPNNRQVPKLLHQAYRGDWEPFARIAIQSNASVGNMLSLPLLLCVTCSEDVDRITEAEIEQHTEGTWVGDSRVRSQIAVCNSWPRSELPDGFAEPVKVDVPVLLLSGSHDPVTPPRWGAVAAKNLPNSLHVVVPGGHGVAGPCVTALQRQFLDSASVAGLDTACVEQMTLPPIALPD